MQNRRVRPFALEEFRAIALRPASCGPEQSVGLEVEARYNCARPNQTLVYQCTGRGAPAKRAGRANLRLPEDGARTLESPGYLCDWSRLRNRL
jgi:hypothetical protein